MPTIISVSRLAAMSPATHEARAATPHAAHKEGGGTRDALLEGEGVPPPPPRLILYRSLVPNPSLQGAMPMPSHCPSDAKCQPQRHL